MPLQFVLGPPGAGKTTHCLNQIEAAISGAVPLYYLVPEQFSLQSEKLLLTNRAATTRVQVLSFNRLAYRLFALLGGPPGQVADDLGKTMILRKVLLEAVGELDYYKRGADKHGFVDALQSTITELNHYRISAEDLEMRSHNMGPALGTKLADLATLLTRYRAAVKGKYVLADNMLDLLAQKLADTDVDIPLLRGACLWVDGFAGFTPQERQVLLYLMKQGVDVKITLTTRNVAGRPHDALFAAPQYTQDRLTELARDARVEVLPAVYIKGNHRHAPGGDLAFFVGNFGVRGAVRGREPHIPNHGRIINKMENDIVGADLVSARACENTDILGQPNAHTNTSLSGQTQGLPLQHGFDHTCQLSPNDISSGREDPASSIEILSAQDRYAAIYAAAHRILTWTAAGYNYSDIAILCGDRNHYEKPLQTAFERLGIPLFVDTEIDILAHPLTELIRAALSILSHNWSYESVFRFLKTRLTGLDADSIDILENYAYTKGIKGYRWQYPINGPEEVGRLHLLEALEGFGRGQDTIKNFSQKIFEMLYKLQVPQTLQAWFDSHMAAGNHATARVHKQIWPKICQVFDKLVEILGDEKVSIDHFASILDAGLEQVGLGRIPPTVDQVVLGDSGRSRYPEIKAMLILGANDGALPPIAPSPGLFTEDERRQLVNTQIELAPDNLTRINEQYYALYCALSQPREKLTFIYAEGEPGGRQLRPSHVLKKVQGLFPGLEAKKAPILREYQPADISPDSQPHVLMSARDMYGQTIITAASRLEAFARCPFAYFVNYLLQAHPRKKYEVLPTDLGTLYHDILAQFTNNVAQGQIDVSALTKSDISGIVSKIVADTTPEMDVFHATARNRHVLSKAENICTASIWALTEHIKRGSFVPLGAELDFGQVGDMTLEDGRSLKLTGRIDRVDMLNTPTGEQFVRIIDYKSGQARFDISEMEQGLQLQLMLYMNALTKGNPHMPNARPAGVFYFPVDDPIIDSDAALTDTARDEALLKRFRMSGVTLDGGNILEGMDRGLAPGGDSSVISVKLNKDGRVSKVGKPLVLSEEEFQRLAKVAEDKAKELAGRMVRGDIAPSPCPKGVRSPCQYCSYGAICNVGIARK